MNTRLYDRPWRATPPERLGELIGDHASSKTLRGFSGSVAALQDRFNLTPLRNGKAAVNLPAANGETPPLESLVFSRLAFGPRPADVDTFRGMGATPRERLENWLKVQLAPETIADDEFDTRLSQSNYLTLEKDLFDLWNDHAREEEDFDYHMLPIYETQHAVILRATYSRRQLAEVLADFWHNHFNVFGWHFFSGPLFVHYDRDVIRTHMLGNFRQFIEDMTAAPAMLFYLDNFFSSADGPNENFAREVLELHTFGEENYYGAIPASEVPRGTDDVPLGYTDEDVREFARCLTGWSIDENTGSFLYRDYWHDDGPKSVLGLDIPAGQQALKDVQDVFDLLATRPGVARFVCTKLCRRLVADNPPESLVDGASGVFLANTDQSDQLERVVRAIVLSDEFADTWGDKVRRPFELVIGAVRSMNPTFSLPLAADFSRYVFWLLYTTGHFPYTWPPPTGFPDRKEIWLTTNALVTSWRLTNLLAGLELDGWRPCDPVAATPGGLRSAAELADYWIDRALLRSIEEPSRQAIIDFMAQGKNPDAQLNLGSGVIKDRLRSMVGLVLMSPEFHWR